ncbi:MAG: carboxypeptidase regulatory-like domain-containing protein [Candidatus Longimicrobiales bacterium M2_2A_002]
MKRFTRFLALFAALSVGVVACEPMTTTGVNDEPDETTPQDGPATLKVLLTDAPADYVAAAWVDIGRVDILPVADGENDAPITLTEDGTDGPVNLLELQDDVQMLLADTTIDPGEYKQLRLIVESASVDLIEGYTFRDGSTSMDLKVPSGAQTGIKLNLWPADGMDGMEDEDAGVRIVPGETVLVVDFDVNQSFVIQGNPETPAGIKSMLFKPTLRVTVQDVAGSISGTVSGAADSINVENLVVTADPTGPGTVTGYQTMTATALTDGVGEYTILYLVPGEYVVTVAPDSGYFSDPASYTVDVGHDEDVMGIDFLLDATGAISGTVTATSDSIAVSGLTVTADGDNGTYTAETGEDGTYTIHDVLPGDYSASLEPPEGFIATPESRDVTVNPGEEATGVDFEVDDPAGSIAGAVTAPEGVDTITVSGLTVTADNGDGLVVEATTGEDGSYSMDYVPTGDYTVTVAVEEGFFTDPLSAAVTVGVNEDVEDVDFVVDETGAIAGTVTAAADSIGVEELTVTAEGENGTFTAATAADGTYLMDLVVPGDYTVTVAVPEGFATTPESTDITVGIGSTTEDVDFEVDEASTGG